MYTRYAQTHGRYGGGRSQTHVHADARSRETQLHYHDERIQWRLPSGQDTRRIHEPVAWRVARYLALYHSPTTHNHYKKGRPYNEKKLQTVCPHPRMHRGWHHYIVPEQRLEPRTRA